MPFMILDIQLLVQGVLYLTAFVMGFVISIPLGVTTMNFGGQCILYADITWANSSFFTFKPTNYINCNFSVYLAVFGCIFYGLGMVIYHGYALTRKDPNIGSQMWVMPFILVNALLTVTIFISSCMVSVGFKVFCDGLMSGQDKGSSIKSCSDGQSSKWNWKSLTGTDYNTSTYFAYLTVCQTATWLCFLVWVVQVALGILRFLRNRRLRSKDQFHDPAPSIDSPANSKTPADLENFASVQPSA